MVLAGGRVGMILRPARRQQCPGRMLTGASMIITSMWSQVRPSKNLNVVNEFIKLRVLTETEPCYDISVTATGI